MQRNLISVSELKARLKEPGCVVLDCRFSLADPAAGLASFQAGSLPGARFLDLEKDLSSAITADSGRHPLPSVQVLLNRLNSLGIEPGQQLVVFDDCAGAMAARAWWMLRELGFSVALLDGGLQAWQAAAGEVCQPVQRSAEAVSSMPVVAWPALSTDQVVRALEQKAVTLVDARAEARFRGEQEPIDPVAGHVPGALNRPLTDNLHDGQFKPAAQLRSEWLALLAGADPSGVVHMCGSGVTACHNLLAMEIAGLSGSRLYAGSWSEWIRHPARPVATGAC
ncbi:sulfurtransferase [Neptuniibacter halophilus]|uniref:sulfurtransferase n=1 Tax=Neptuniibacter halophilus TaxID=651666 RepID=UPI002573B14E|nr:sulfurtransferase [Neptuniibacter halophilus]